MAVSDLSSHLLLVLGDITQLRADVIVFSTSTAMLGSGHLYGAFVARLPWFTEAYADAVQKIRPGKVGCAVGQALCLEPPDGRGPAVVVVASTIDYTYGTTTREQLGRDDCAMRAVRGALAAANEYLQKQPKNRRYQVAFPALRMGLGGDRNDRLRSARTQVRVALECLKGIPGVDVAFVSFIPDNHQIFLQARRDVLGGPVPCPLPEGSESKRLTQLVREIRAGRCVLFVGSGLSWQLPGWAQLLNVLASHLGRQPRSTFDLKAALDLADDYLWERGGDQLAQEIRDRYADYDRLRVRPTAPHYHLLSLPLRLVITTNYDDLIERTLTALRRHHRRVLRDQDVVFTGTPDPLCVVKFHGDPSENGGRGIVLARGQYEAFRVQHPGLALLLAGSLLNQTFLFVGYSRMDPNFREIFDEVASLYEGAEWRAFATAVDSPNPTPNPAGQLEVLQMPASDDAARIHQLALFLDWLADAVLSGPRDIAEGNGAGTAEDLPPGLFLAPDVPVVGHGAAHSVRRGLEQVAKVVEEACNSERCPNLGSKEARHLARVLRFLVEQGWRPAETHTHTASIQLSRMWERLGECVADKYERDRCLAAAWRFAERHADVERLQILLCQEEWK